MKKYWISIIIFLLLVIGYFTLITNQDTFTENTITHLILYDPQLSDESTYMNLVREYTGQDYHIQVGTSTKYLEKLTLDLSTETSYALVDVSGDDFGYILENDLALDLTPYLEQYGSNIMDKISKEAWDTVTFSDKIYGIPDYTQTKKVGEIIMYRKDILKKEKLEVPKTIEDVKSTVCTLSDRGYTNPWALNYKSVLWEYDLRQSFGVGYMWNESEDGTLEYLGKDDRFLEYLKYVKSIYDCGGFGHDYGYLTQKQRESKFIKGEAVFLMEPYSKVSELEEGFNTLELNMEDVVGITSAFEGANGHKATPAVGEEVRKITFIPSYMEQYAIDIISFVNELYSEEFIIQAYYGVEGQTFEYSSDGVPYLLPNASIEYEQARDYEIGNFDSLDKKSYEKRMENLEKSDSLNLEEKVEIQAQQYVSVGEYDPLGKATNLPLWSKNSGCANARVSSFADAYIAGAKTDNDFESLKKELNEVCKMDEVQEEVNEWYINQ